MLKPCQECGNHARPAKSDPADYPPGTPKFQARGLCVKCYSAWRRGSLETVYDPKVITCRADRIEDLAFLLKYDHNAESVARRAGFTNSTSAIRTLQRWGAHDLANTLRHYQAGIDVYRQDHFIAA